MVAAKKDVQAHLCVQAKQSNLCRQSKAAIRQRTSFQEESVAMAIVRVRLQGHIGHVQAHLCMYVCVYVRLFCEAWERTHENENEQRPILCTEWEEGLVSRSCCVKEKDRKLTGIVRTGK